MRGAQFLDAETVGSIWQSGVPIVVPVTGTTKCNIVFQPGQNRLSCVVPYDASHPDATRYRHLTAESFVQDGEEVSEIAITVEGNVHEAFSLLAAVAIGMRDKGMTVAEALSRAIARNRALLARVEGFSTEREIGLFGELVFVEHLMNLIGPMPALQTWQGPYSEEHDFTLAGADVEVKTTATESRSHTIHGLSQLLPTDGTDLYLVSVQIARTAPTEGRTLPALIGGLRVSAGAAHQELDERLLRVGWNDDFTLLSTTSWRLRSTPRAYLVDDAFPAMTPDRIRAVVPDAASIGQVVYQVDVTTRPDSGLPQPYDSFAPQSRENDR